VPVASLLILLLVPAADTGPAPDAEVLHLAETTFQQGVSLHDKPDEARQAFHQAAERYEDLRTRGIDNPLLLRNAGNAYLLAGDLPRAILAYRRGLRLDPNDGVLRANLDYARGQVTYPPAGNLGRPAVEAWPPWLPRPTPGMVLALVMVLYVAGCVALTRWWMLRRRSLLTGGCLLLAAAALTGTGLAVWEARLREETQHSVVVMAEDGVLLRQGNGLTYPPRYETPVNRGVEARLLFARGDWLKIELSGGETGWVPRRYALVE
jgi:tetratricopeptide (TPR) repeat protein